MNTILQPHMTGTRYHVLTTLKKAVYYTLDKYFDKNKKLPFILDDGCGIKPYESVFAPYFDKYLGADIADNPDYDILIEENGAIAIDSNSVDTVLSSQVLEHVTDVSAYLKEAHRVLKPNGLMLLSTHGYWMYHPHPTDLWRWTRDGLEKTIAKEGFEIVETLGLVNLAASGLQLFQDGIQFKLPKFLRPILALIILFAQKIVDRGRFNNRDAALYLVIARKKV